MMRDVVPIMLKKET